MLKAFSNIPIFRRLAIVFAVAVFIPMLVIVLLGNLSLQSSTTRSQAVHTSFDAQNIATNEQINLQRLNALLQARFAQVFSQGGNLALAGDPSSGKLTENDVNALETQFSQALTNYRKNYEIATSSDMGTIRSILLSDAPVEGQQVIIEQQRALDTVVQKDWPNYQALLHKVLQDLAANTFYQVAYADFYQADLGFLELKNVWQQVVDTATAMGTRVTEVGPSLTNPLIIYTCLALIFTLLVIIAAGFLVNVTIVFPLNHLALLTKRVARGETQVRANIRGRDEIGQVATSINGMLDHILELMQEAQTRHAELQAQILKMIREVSGIGEGNLRIHVQITSTELVMLANAFNLMAEELNILVVNVKIIASGVQKTTLQAFGYMEQLVDNAEAQFQTATQATGEMGHVANSSRKIAERAQILYDVADGARQAAFKGRQSVRQTVTGMEHINENVKTTSLKVLSLREHSLEIRNIVEVISSIAQQTNRLALDASVQAAMAGENGKGFSAVALDIRRQAERAKAQSALIGQIVKNVTEDINIAANAINETTHETSAGTQLAQEVDNALDQLFSAVERQASEIDETNQVAKQQLQATTRAVQMMNYVSDSTRQSSVITRNVSQQINELARLAGQLLTSVDVFKLREDSAHNGRTSDNYVSQGGQRQINTSRPLRSLRPFDSKGSGAR